MKKETSLRPLRHCGEDKTGLEFEKEEIQ